MARFERKAKSQRKHGPPSDSGASRAPGFLPVHRPEWKGPGYVKKAPRRPAAPAPSSAPGSASHIQEQVLPDHTQQLVLDVFRDALPTSNDFDALKPVLREIKDAMADRDFERAFGTEELRESYAIRWGPSKALACANLLAWICDEVEDDEWVERFSGGGEDHVPAKALGFGRGAEAFVALTAALKHVQPSSAAQSTQSLPNNDAEEQAASEESQSARDGALLSLCLVDGVDWTGVLSKLHDSLVTPPPLSQYASAKARASNAPFLPRRDLDWNFTRLDVLDCGTEDLRSMVGPEPALLTFLFSLNELYAASLPKATTLLRNLTEAAPKGSLLLVVDEPGACVESRAAAAAGDDASSSSQGKRYPMHWLMYRALMPQEPKAKKGDEVMTAWEKVFEVEDGVSKLPGELRFPASLENLKFQMHLLRRL